MSPVLQENDLTDVFFSTVYVCVHACGCIRMVVAQTDVELNGVTAQKVICYANTQNKIVLVSQVNTKPVFLL